MSNHIIPIDRPSPLPLGTWCVVVANVPMCGTWLRVAGYTRTCRGTWLVFDGGATAAGDALSIVLPPEFVRVLPAATWWNLPRRLWIHAIAWGMRLFTRTFAREAAQLAVRPTRLDLLRQELGRLKHENTQLACELAREQAKHLSLRPWLESREAN